MGRGHQTGRSAPGAALPGAAKPPGSRPLQPEDGPPRAQRGPRCCAGAPLPCRWALTAPRNFPDWSRGAGHHGLSQGAGGSGASVSMATWPSGVC